MSSSSAFKRGDGTWSAARRAIAEPKDAFSCTGNFNHRRTREYSEKPDGSACLRIEAHNLGVENCGEGHPGRVRNESVGSGAIDFARGGDVRRNRSFQRYDVSQG